MGILSNALMNDGGGKGTNKPTTTSKTVNTGNGVLNSLLSFADRAKLSQQEELARKIANAGKKTGLPTQTAGGAHERSGGRDSAPHERSIHGARDTQPMGPVWNDKLSSLKDRMYPVPESGTYFDKYPAPYVPGISDNPGINNTTFEPYGQQNADGTPNKTYFPDDKGGYYRGPYAGDTNYTDTIGGGSMQDIRDELGRVGNPNYSDYAEGNSGRPGLRSAGDMANYHGIDYNQENMRAILDKATQEKYNNLDTEHERNQRDYYNMTSQSSYQLQDALMRGDRGAAMSNATRGTGTSERLAALHGTSAVNAEGATEIGRLRADLVGQRESDLAANAERAMSMYNELGINLGTLSAREQDALAVAYNAELANSATRYQADMNFKATLRQVLGNLEAQQSANATQLELERSKQQHEGNIMNHPFWQQQNS